MADSIHPLGTEGTRASRFSREELSVHVLGLFEELRRLASDPQLPPEVADRIIDEAWRLVEKGDPVRVRVASEVLRVSGPTVRSWIAHGLLEQGRRRPDSKGPVTVTLPSVAKVRVIADELRATGRHGRLVSDLKARLEEAKVSNTVRDSR